MITMNQRFSKNHSEFNENIINLKTKNLKR